MENFFDFNSIPEWEPTKPWGEKKILLPSLSPLPFIFIDTSKVKVRLHQHDA